MAWLIIIIIIIALCPIKYFYASLSQFAYLDWLFFFFPFSSDILIVCILFALLRVSIISIVFIRIIISIMNLFLMFILLADDDLHILMV